MWHLYNIPEVNYLTPIVWETYDYNFAMERANFYSVSGYPDCRFDGQFGFSWGDYLNEYYYPQYHERETVYSPILINAEMERNDNILSLSARIELKQEIDDGLKNIYLGYTATIDSVNAAIVYALEIEEFFLTQPGEILEIQYDIEVESNFTDDMLKGFLFIQNIETKEIYQGKNVIIHDELNAWFTSNIQQGPGILTVNFENQTTPELSADSYEWDLDGDGSIDSTERNPVYNYEEIGSYDVKLIATKDNEQVEILMEDYITVTDYSNISGTVSGTWNLEHSPYIITGDVVIAEESELVLEPGTKVICEDGNIIVKGKITALGLDTEPIIFEGDADWNGIEIDSRWISEFDYCRFYGANDTAILADNSIINISNSIFWGNSGQPSAAAIELDNCDNFIITGNLISGNENTSYCGGIGFENSIGTISNNIIVNNTGGPAGAVALKEDSDVTLINNTIVNNQGGASIFVHSSDLYCMNSIIRGSNSIFMNISSDISVDYCNLSEDYGGTNNLNLDPLFVDPTIDSGSENSYLAADWSLSNDSPCIDAGNPDPQYNDLNGSLNDMGAFGWNLHSLTTTTNLELNFISSDELNGALVTLSAISGEIWEETITDDYNLSWEGILTSKYDVTISKDGNEFTSIIEFYEDSSFEIEVIFTKCSDDLMSSSNIRLSNYPNPFNPTTSIAFSLDEAKHVTLEIYNIRGEKVRTLIGDEFSADHHKVVWNGTDDSGNSVSSGVYFYKMKAGDSEKTRKMVLLK